MVCKNCGKTLENNDNNKKLIVLSRICLFSLIAVVLSFCLALLLNVGFILIFSFIAYVVQIISSIILFVKYPKYKYSKIYLILGILTTIFLVAMIILTIVFLDRVFGTFFDLFNGSIDALNSCNIPG